MKDQKIPLPSICRIFTWWKIYTSVQRHEIIFQQRQRVYNIFRRKKDTNQTFNNIAFPKQGDLINIEKYIILWLKNDWNKERICKNWDIWKVEILRINSTAVYVE